MGISLGSLLTIQGNETMVEVYSNREKTRYGFIIYLMRDGEIHTEIVSTLPHCPYNSEEQAQTAGDEVVRRVKAMNLNPERSKLIDMMGSETAEAVSEVIRKAREGI